MAGFPQKLKYVCSDLFQHVLRNKIKSEINAKWERADKIQGNHVTPPIMENETAKTCKTYMP